MTDAIEPEEFSDREFLVMALKRRLRLEKYVKQLRERLRQAGNVVRCNMKLSDEERTSFFTAIKQTLTDTEQYRRADDRLTDSERALYGLPPREGVGCPTQSQ